MIQIPTLFQQRINKIIKDYNNKIRAVNDKYASKREYYYKKLKKIESEMEQIYNDDNISVINKGEKFVQLTSTFEKYMDKYEEPKHKIYEISNEFENEIKKISDMIHQYKPNENIKDINDAVIKYIIQNSK